MVVEWRGKPVWILHRTPEMLATLKNAKLDLADPASGVPRHPDYATNEQRSQKPEYFVAIDVCTHLGYSPSKAFNVGDPALGKDWPGGFLCPCHGSTFDFAGRVFKNKPAPTNLEIPPHTYLSQGRLIIVAIRMARRKDIEVMLLSSLPGYLKAKLRFLVGARWCKPRLSLPFTQPLQSLAKEISCKSLLPARIGKPSPNTPRCV